MVTAFFFVFVFGFGCFGVGVFTVTSLGVGFEFVFSEFGFVDFCADALGLRTHVRRRYVSLCLTKSIFPALPIIHPLGCEHNRVSGIAQLRYRV